MKQDIKLYISDMLVDFSNELDMPFVYQLEDTNNPTIVKNFFTKTITIVGTKQNNKIFGDIYNLDRTQLYDESYLTGAYFNPSYRTPFQLFKNGELVESGYMQLNSITLKNKIINYEITLYGGMGDFFYGLMYNKDDEKLTLGDLVYGVEDDMGNVLEPEKEMDFNINAHFVKDCWDNLTNIEFPGRQLKDFITFVPSYNGIYNNFDNNKVLINTHNCNAFTTTEKTVDDVKYSTYNGFALAELKNDMTEWEIRDLRSYMQRPALRMKRLIEAICNPVNNGGYKVELDSNFFSPGNPYFEKTFIALPLFSTALEAEDSDNIAEDIDGVATNKLNAGMINGQVIDLRSTYIIPTDNELLPTEGNEISGVNLPVQSTLSFKTDYQLHFKTDATTQPNLYDGYGRVNIGPRPPQGGSGPIVTKVGTATYLQAVAYDGENKIIGYSNIYTFANFSTDGTIGTFNNYLPAPVEANIVNISGKWYYDANAGLYSFEAAEGGNTFRIEMNNIQRSPIIQIKLYVGRYRNGNYVSPVPTSALASSYSDSNNNPVEWFEGEFVIPLTGIKIGIDYPNLNIFSNAKITKQKLLKTEKTPADYLLSYCKLFGLYFSKDTANKTIYIRQRNNFFTDNTIDWNDRIDYSKEVKINPIMFDNKFYKFALKGKDDYYGGKYKNEYGVEYGQKRVNTNYNFNNETVDLLKDNVFENSVPALDSSQYYRVCYNKDGVEVPAFMLDGITYKLFNITDTELESTDIEMASNVNLKAMVNFNEKSGYDLFEKQVFFKRDNNKESLNDINNCLLFFTTPTWTTKPPTTDEEEPLEIKYWLTDDVAEIGVLNDKKPCYIYTEDSFSSNNNFVGYQLETIPQFLSYRRDLNNIIDSLDFGVPKEIYMYNVNYDDGATIYNRYWDEFYKDQLSVNTKKLTCYVNLNGLNVSSELLRNFYYFNNSIWILNKIDNYNPNSYGTTKCEFIKVQNTYNYTNTIGVTNKYLTAEYPTTVDYKAGSVAVTVDSSVNWEVGSIYNSNILRIEDEIGGPGKTVIYVSYTQNDSYETKPISFVIEEVGNPNYRHTVTITQKPDPSKTVIMEGTVKWDNGGMLPGGRMLILNNDSVIATTYINEYTGGYKIYVPKNVTVQLEIQADILYGDDAVYIENYTYNGSDNQIKRNFVVPYRTEPII